MGREIRIVPIEGSQGHFYINVKEGVGAWVEHGRVDVIQHEGSKLSLNVTVTVSTLFSLGVSHQVRRNFDGRVTVNTKSGEISWPENIPAQLMAALGILIGIISRDTHPREG